MSGPPLEPFENSSHLDDFGPSQGPSGAGARCLPDRLSFLQSMQSRINFSDFLPGNAEILARTGKIAPRARPRPRPGQVFPCVNDREAFPAPARSDFLRLSRSRRPPPARAGNPLRWSARSGFPSIPPTRAGDPTANRYSPPPLTSILRHDQTES